MPSLGLSSHANLALLCDKRGSGDDSGEQYYVFVVGSSERVAACAFLVEELALKRANEVGLVKLLKRECAFVFGGGCCYDFFPAIYS